MIGPLPTLNHLHPLPRAADSRAAPVASDHSSACDYEAITQRLDEVCDGLTPSQIASAIGLTRPAAVRRYLSGFAPSVEFVVRLCDTFGVSTDWVLLGRGSNDPDEHQRYWLAQIETAALVDELRRRLTDERS